MNHISAPTAHTQRKAERIVYLLVKLKVLNAAIPQGEMSVFVSPFLPYYVEQDVIKKQQKNSNVFQTYLFFLLVIFCLISIKSSSSIYFVYSVKSCLARAFYRGKYVLNK